MQKYHCCIPGCNAYDTLNNFLAMPCESQWRSQWLLRIKRKDWIVDATIVACRKHFENPEVTTFTKVLKDGNCEKNLSVVNTKCAPSLFPDPRIDSIRRRNICLYPKHMFCLYDRDCLAPSTLTETQSANTDFILSYCTFKAVYLKRLQIFLKSKWRLVTTMTDIIFYTVDFSETPRITCTVSVDKRLFATVTLAGRTMDPLDLTWILPVDGKLNRWSQLEIMLSVFGK